MPARQLASNPIAWIQSMANWNETIGAFQLAESQPCFTLLNSCFAALALETSGGLVNISSPQRKQWASYIAGYQRADGHFFDPLLEQSDLQSSGHNMDYLTWQFTFFSLAALHVLHEKPAYPLSFLELFLQSNDLDFWLENRNWSDPWLESNNIMFLISFLLMEGERTGIAKYHDAVANIFNWLDEHQNPRTGYWDLGQGASLLNAMAGAFHFYFLYFYTGRKIAHIEKIIDSTLSLQQKDGLFDPDGGGGACLDLDAVDILVKFGMLTDYRAKDVKQALTGAFEAILSNQNPDGGFCEAKRPPIWEKSLKRKVVELVGLDKILRRPWQGRPVEFTSYSGWTKMSYRIDESDLWSTWFRTLTLALISTRYPGEFLEVNHWRFASSPSLGWHDEAQIQRMKNNS